jgi:hypothetical protein
MAKAPVTKASVTKAATKTRSASKPDGNASEIETLPGIFVRSFSPTFRRAGFEFTQEGRGLALNDLSEAQLEAICNEPMLNVRRDDVSASAADESLSTEQVVEGSANNPANPDATTDTNANGGGNQSDVGNV